MEGVGWAAMLLQPAGRVLHPAGGWMQPSERGCILPDEGEMVRLSDDVFFAVDDVNTRLQDE